MMPCTGGAVVPEAALRFLVEPARAMKRLILTNDSSAAGHLGTAGVGDFRISLERQLVWGKLPSDAELSEFFGRRKKSQSSLNWQDYQPKHRLEGIDAVGLGLIELCSRFDTIELWIDPRPNDQLQLICLLHFLSAHREIISKLSLLQAQVLIGSQEPEVVAKQKLPTVGISSDHLVLASRAWRAFAATPQDWFGLLTTDLSLLPQLRNAVTALLEELPWRGSGLGATEMRMLEFISVRKPTPADVGRHEARGSGRVFGYWEQGALLDGLGRCRKPPVSGLKEGPFTMALHSDRARYKRYCESKLGLTPLGYAILARTDDFARHNPIRRWWGGTRLTNKHLWRWDPDNKVLVAP
jgi:hypothetical protein